MSLNIRLNQTASEHVDISENLELLAFILRFTAEAETPFSMIKLIWIQM